MDLLIYCQILWEFVSFGSFMYVFVYVLYMNTHLFTSIW